MAKMLRGKVKAEDEHIALTIAFIRDLGTCQLISSFVSHKGTFLWIETCLAFK